MLPMEEKPMDPLEFKSGGLMTTKGGGKKKVKPFSTWSKSKKKKKIKGKKSKTKY